MASTLTSILLHIVFSTKNRREWIVPEIESELYGYIGGIMNSRGCRLLDANGTRDHIHMLVSMNKNMTIVALMEEVKKDSSRWIKGRRPELAEFYWQDGYGAFSIGQSNLAALQTYLARQKEHHTRVSFQEEYRKLLQRYQIEFDERYLWK